MITALVSGGLVLGLAAGAARAAPARALAPDHSSAGP